MRISDWSSDVCSSDLVLAFEHLHDDRPRDHELDEVVEEWALLMDRIEALGLLARHLDALRGDDAQAGILEHRGDGAGQVAARGIGLEIGRASGRERVCQYV